MSPRYPDVTVMLVGEDANTFAIMGRVNQALKKGPGVSREEREGLPPALQSGDHEYLLRTVMEWVEVE